MWKIYFLQSINIRKKHFLKEILNMIYKIGNSTIKLKKGANNLAADHKVLGSLLTSIFRPVFTLILGLKMLTKKMT